MTLSKSHLWTTGKQKGATKCSWVVQILFMLVTHQHKGGSRGEWATGSQKVENRGESKPRVLPWTLHQDPWTETHVLACEGTDVWPESHNSKGTTTTKGRKLSIRSKQKSSAQWLQQYLAVTWALKSEPGWGSPVYTTSFDPHLKPETQTPNHRHTLNENGIWKDEATGPVVEWDLNQEVWVKAKALAHWPVSHGDRSTIVHKQSL